MANAPGWQQDPERGDHERFWSGSAWTDQVRPTASSAASRVPGHGPQLHRALAASTTDIDAVESRLSTIFERATTDSGSAWPRPGIVPPAEPERDDDDLDSAFAELDAALASEEPDEPDPARRGPFRRRG
jgi:hypothetical protein